LYLGKLIIRSVREFIARMLLGDKKDIKKNTEDKVEHSDMSITLKYFDLSEFDCPCEEGSGKYMDENFLIKLDTARDIAGVPFKINSGVSNSSHTNIPCNAADISAKDSKSRFVIINALLQAGFTRIGIGETFIHCDTDTEKKSPNVCWTYY
jgi:zinc D-Ala-D-Ala carboxypeptidase